MGRLWTREELNKFMKVGVRNSAPAARCGQGMRATERPVVILFFYAAFRFNWLLSFINIVMPSRSVFIVDWALN